MKAFGICFFCKEWGREQCSLYTVRTQRAGLKVLPRGFSFKILCFAARFLIFSLILH